MGCYGIGMASIFEEEIPRKQFLNIELAFSRACSWKCLYLAYKFTLQGITIQGSL